MAEHTPKPQVVFGRPMDRSLEAYKEFITTWVRDKKFTALDDMIFAPEGLLIIAQWFITGVQDRRPDWVPEGRMMALFQASLRDLMLVKDPRSQWWITGLLSQRPSGAEERTKTLSRTHVITGMTKALTGKDDTSMNDAQWEASWKRFWEKAQHPKTDEWGQVAPVDAGETSRWAPIH